MNSPRKLAAVLAADVVGYSRQTGLDEEGTLQRLRDLRNELIDPTTTQHRGRVVKTMGDGFLIEFASAVDAVRCAIAIQRGALVRNVDVAAEWRIELRIGINVGDVVVEGDDLLGDGVNVAARLEGIAEPGGICVSESAFQQVRDKLDVKFTDGGPKSLKNIARPVRVYSVTVSEGKPTKTGARAIRLAPTRRGAVAVVAGMVVVVAAVAIVWFAPWRSRTESAPEVRAALTLPSKPSIAVLPFENMSGDPEQAYFADGMTEDLITDLSKVAGLFVIARNSTFAYKGKARDVREIARTLGVRYVLEGSVRRAGGDVRVNAQLIDGANGGHLWAERYDGDLQNIFGLQDKVTRSVVAALSVELTRDDTVRVSHRGTENAQAYDVYLRGWQHYLRQTPENFRIAIVEFKKAAELDPKYGRAYAALAATYWEASRRYWDIALGFSSNHVALQQAEQYLRKAMRDPTPLAHQVASAMLLQSQEHREAIAEAERAIKADPNDADGYIALAGVLSFAGRGSEALEFVERAMRLNPLYPPRYLYQQGLAQFSIQRFDTSAASLERAMTLDPGDYWSQRLLLSTYGLLGRREQASKLVQAMKSNDKRGKMAYYDPLTIKGITYWHPFANAADADRFADGLRKAGLPE